MAVTRVVPLGIKDPPKCRCGLPLTYLAVTKDEKGLAFWCRNCDAHGTGCKDRNHPHAQCRIEG